MGFFSSLFGSKKKGLQKSDKVYLHRKTANKALIQHCVDAVMAGRRVVIIYFFKETRTELEAGVMNATNVQWVHAFFTSQLRTAAVEGWHNVEVIFAETYPDLFAEQNVLLEMEVTGYANPTVTFYNGLDDPIFMLFGAERIQHLMKTMGLKEDEPVEHSMITKSMDRAQRKIADRKMNIGRVESRGEMVRRLQQ
ncbi:MAG TPA: hypothetical protein VD905_13150 [Flavobacteriales bacterium]|nr:hypothetical protein [Flavobacteriales bacterium]